MRCPQHILTLGRQKPAEICPQRLCAADLRSDITSKVNSLAVRLTVSTIELEQLFIIVIYFKKRSKSLEV
jgi:hypothetical protein